MNKLILNSENQSFIKNNLSLESSSILLGKSYQKLPLLTELVSQIESKKKCLKKLPTWYNASKIYYPSKLNIEQTSSEITAKYKSLLVNGKTLLDLTSGFGIDEYYFAKRFEKVIGCEINEELVDIVRHNFKILKTNNVSIICIDGIEYLKTMSGYSDVIYVDPSRRNEIKGKVYRFEDCEPDVIKNLDFLFQKTKTILIKSSPLVDVSAGIKILSYVSEIHIVAVNNEVKELLWILKRDYENDVKITAINLSEQKEDKFSYNLTEENEAESEFSTPLTYLYEPNVSILKSGAFKIISKRFNVFKLHVSSHLYTSNEIIDFPGRVFRIVRWEHYNKRLLQKSLPKKANITTRNFPKTVSELRKELKISDGGPFYLFFSTNGDNEKIVVICEQI